MRPGYPDVLVLEGYGDVAVAALAFGLNDQPTASERIIHALTDPNDIVVIEADQSQATLDALVGFAALNTDHSAVKIPAAIERHYRRLRPAVRRDTLRLSDLAASMVVGYMDHPSYDVRRGNHPLISLEALSICTGRRAITKSRIV